MSSTFCDSISVEKLDYRPPAANRSGGKVVHVYTVPGSREWEHRIRFQMSEDQTKNLQNAVWGLSSPLPGQDASRRTLELSIESPTLLKFLDDLDKKNIDVAKQNSPEWFKKNLDEDAIKNMYVYLVKQPSKEGQKPTVRVKVKCTEQYPTNIFVVQSCEGNELKYTKGTPEDLTKNSKCMAIVESVGLWFMSRQFGMSLTATDILVWPNRRMSGIDAFTFDNAVVQKVEAPPAPVPVDDVAMDEDEM